MSEELTAEEMEALAMLSTFDDRQVQSQAVPELEENVISIVEIAEEEIAEEQSQLSEITIDSKPIGIQLKLPKKEKKYTPSEIIDMCHDEISNQVHKVFPENRVDISNNRVTIHFEDIFISNSNNQVHKIPSIYVRIPYAVNTSSITSDIKASELDLRKYINLSYGMLGFTNVLTREMVDNSYMHSHLPSQYLEEQGNEPFFDNFCLGESDVSRWINKLSDSATDFDFELFNFLLNSLEEFLSWESLEGVPYVYISNLTSGGDSSIVDQLTINGVRSVPSYLDSFKDYILEDFNEIADKALPSMVDFDAGSKRIVQTRRADSFTLDDFNLNLVSYGDYYFLKKDIIKANTEIIENPEEDVEDFGYEVEESFESGLVFKGEDITIEILDKQTSGKKELVSLANFGIPRLIYRELRRMERHIRILNENKIYLNEEEQEQ